MHRLLMATEDLKQECPALPQAARQHLKVLRPKSGETIELFDGKGGTRIYVWQNGELKAVQPLRTTPPPRPSRTFTLFACVTKGSRWDWTLEKATELGVSRIVPVISERTIVRIPAAERAAKRERWQRITEEAARQSDAVWLPEIHEAVDFRAALELAKATECFVGALVSPKPEALLTAAEKAVGGEGPYSVFIGPEGDFTPEEMASLLEIATPTSFGPTILRAETAAIYACSVLAAVLADYQKL